MAARTRSNQRATSSRGNASCPTIWMPYSGPKAVGAISTAPNTASWFARCNVYWSNSVRFIPWNGGSRNRAKS